MEREHDFGAALRTIRKVKGLPQDALGLTQSNVSRLEGGVKAPSWERVEALAEVLGVHPLTVFTLSYFDGSAAGLQDLQKRIKAELREIIGTSQ